MKPKEAAQVIDAIVKSLRDNPTQFHVNVGITMAGAVGIGGMGGPGIVGIAQGGGVGFSASASAPGQVAIDIAQQQGIAQLDAEYGALLTTLEEIKAEVLKSNPSKMKANGLLKRLVGTWIPDVIVAVVAKVVATAIGNA